MKFLIALFFAMAAVCVAGDESARKCIGQIATKVRTIEVPDLVGELMKATRNIDLETGKKGSSDSIFEYMGLTDPDEQDRVFAQCEQYGEMLAEAMTPPPGCNAENFIDQLRNDRSIMVALIPAMSCVHLSQGDD